MLGKILLVEDEELVGIMVKINLEAIGYQVTWLQSGTSVVDMVKTEAFDLLLLDINIPGINGLEIIKKLRKAGEKVPIMMLTAMNNIKIKVEALENGADDYLNKPFDVPEMIARVKALVRRTKVK